MKKLLALLLAVVMCFSLVACGGDKKDDSADKPADSAKPSQSQLGSGQATTEVKPPEATTKYKETVYWAYTSEPANGDPYLRVATADRTTTNLTHDALCILDWENGEALPNIVTEWTDVNGDGKLWEVKMAEGVTFHDAKGEVYGEATAEDIKFTFEYAGVGGTGGVGYPLNVYAQMDEIEIVDDYTLRFHLNTALYDFAFYLTGDCKLLCKAAFDEFDATTAAEVGAGPYWLNYEETMPGSQWTYTRFEGYWGGAENYATKNLVFRLIPDTTTMDKTLETGDIDLALAVSAQDIASLEAAGRVVTSIPGSSNTFFAFNYHNFIDVEDDLALRQAIAHAIDKQAVMAVWYAGLPSGSESNNFAVTVIPGYTEMDNVYPYDVAKAQEIMEGLGYNANNRLHIRLAHYESYRKIAEAVQALLSEIYIDIEPVLIDGSNFASFLRGQEGWDCALNYASMGGAMFYDFNRFLNSQGSTQPLYGFSSPEYDQMQADAMNSGSFEAMKAGFADIQKWVMEQVAFLPIAVGNMNVGTTAELEGLNMNPNLQLINLSTIRVPE